jgi:Arc/MetJ-type ribon-helix-helix transcriptional regulator
MSKQLTVRLPEEIVDFIDQCVEGGKASSRAAVVAAAVDRERRRAIAEHDVAILTRAGSSDDFDELAAYASRTDLADLD